MYLPFYLYEKESEITNVLNILKTAKSVRGQNYRIVRLVYTSAPTKDLAQSLTFPGGASCMVSLIKDMALILYKVESRDSQDTYTLTPDLKMLLNADVNEVKIEHLALLSQGNNAKQIIEIAELMDKHASICAGTMRFVDTSTTDAADEDSILTMEAVMHELKLVRMSEYLIMCANAKRAKFLKKVSPLQMSLIKMREEIDRFMKAKEQCSMSIQHMDSVHYRLTRDFSPTLLTMEGVYWSSITQTIETTTLGDWKDKTGHKMRSMFLVGGNEAGKSSLMLAMAKMFCVRLGLDEFVFLKKLDPVGMMTLTGQVGSMSSFIFTDFVMKSQNDQIMNAESVKALIDPWETGSYPARYHVAQLPLQRARMFAVNAGLNEDKTIDFGSWFDNQMYCEPLAALARGDEEALRNMADDEQAIARRTVIFKIHNREQIGLVVTSAKKELEDTLELELERERVYNAAHAD
ncbi:unnamed protein product [Polarella glacialis]|uniref:Uncharacterized protein n=1 Tax=Polarella glacialis TaxID=89957 RepID=A0A813KG49_POLGL|nr:unnamed protein product [Polarella glacialis]